MIFSWAWMCNGMIAGRVDEYGSVSYVVKWGEMVTAWKMSKRMHDIRNQDLMVDTFERRAQNRLLGWL